MNIFDISIMEKSERLTEKIRIEITKRIPYRLALGASSEMSKMTIRERKANMSP
ncbi:MAG: hypothetical protein FJ116_06710 [Deltaproteobacteria bacterium]|nr:hypothetical protein [Deltaproteobacteria bacterium]